MADENKNIEELTDEEVNDLAGGFIVTPKQLGFVTCATEGCKNRFKPKNGETLCESCRQKAGGGNF